MIHKVIRHSLFFALSLYLFTLANAVPTDEEKEEFEETLNTTQYFIIVPVSIGVLVWICFMRVLPLRPDATKDDIYVWQQIAINYGCSCVFVGCYIPTLILVFISLSYGYGFETQSLYSDDSLSWYSVLRVAGYVFFFVPIVLVVWLVVWLIYMYYKDIDGGVKCTNCFNRCTKCFENTAETSGGTSNKPEGVNPIEYRQQRFNII